MTESEVAAKGLEFCEQMFSTDFTPTPRTSLTHQRPKHPEPDRLRWMGLRRHNPERPMPERSALYWQVYQRLTDDEELDDQVRSLVEAAFDGPQTVMGAIGAEPDTAERKPVPAEVTQEPERAFLKRITIQGFRGIGPKTTFDVPPGPGLTLVVGRNGSGKSSVAEGLEMLLTGESQRWAGRQKEWLGGFRNLHQPDPTALTATFDVDGSAEELRIRRAWKADEKAEAGTIKVTSNKREDLSLDTLGWSEALTTFRPILSYNELGKALDKGPAHLFDLLRGVLGMDELSGAEQALATVRKAADAVVKAAKQSLAPLQQRLQALPDDQRAIDALGLLKKRAPDLAALLEIASGDPEDESVVRQLRGLATLAAPETEIVLQAATRLRDTVAEQTRLRAAAAGLQFDTADLLQRALSWHERETTDRCPVCETNAVLDENWRLRSKQRLAELSESSKQVKAADAAEKTALGDAQRLIRSVKAPEEVALPGFVAAQHAYQTWSNAPADPVDLANHLESAYDQVASHYPALVTQATDELAKMQAEWQPARRALENWIEQAELAEAAKAQIKLLKAAETWVKETDKALRAQRFAPIRNRAQEIWEALRHQSNVSINDIRLEGTKTKRKVHLDVVVDGKEAMALGVMSQGELHAMLLALFLPRLTLDESPFGFLVVDDPVQAMDPAKVDGLARVLHDVAKRRQVIVLTHDARLPEAVRRLQLDATVFEVARQTDSVVELRKTRDPADQLIADAFQIVDEREKMGPELTGRVVPGLCRTALEVRLKQIVWRELLRSGWAHSEIEEAIVSARKVHTLASLAFLGDAERGGELFRTMNNKFGSQAVDTFKELKEHVHQTFNGDVSNLTHRTKQLLKRLS